MPERKLWWRNLRGGAPVRLRLRLRLRGEDRAGQARAAEKDQSHVSVDVLLD